MLDSLKMGSAPLLPEWLFGTSDSAESPRPAALMLGSGTFQASTEAGSTDELVGLLHEVAKGNVDSFKRLYKATSTTLMLQVRRHVWQRHEAEEVLQQVYIKIWNCAGQYDARLANGSTWMARIARNAAIDHLRRNEARVAVEVPDWRPVQDESVSAERDFPCPEPTPMEILANRQAKHQMELLLQRLPAVQRQCLVLALLDGLSHSEIAEQFGAPLGTVKSWMRRGMQSLKAMLEESGVVSPDVLVV